MRNACSSCATRKRRCNRARPRCGTCIRTARVCVYEEDSNSQRPIQSSSQPVPITSTTLLSSANLQPQLRYGLPTSRIDPFQHDDLRSPAVERIIRDEMLKVLGSLDRIPEIAEAYFRTVHHRLTIISNKRFMDKLPTISSGGNATYLALCLCMFLLQQQPDDNIESMRLSLYVTAKSIVNILTAAGFYSLDVVQSLVMISFYEIGHGIYPAASMSVVACAKLARGLGLQKNLHFQAQSAADRIEHEEKKRVWWVILNFDRYINLCEGDALLVTEDPKQDTPLPVEDRNWLDNVVPIDHSVTLATPSDVTVGQLARECQVSHLAGRVIRHVFDPISDHGFQAKEAQQLERTLKAFLPLLVEDQAKFSKYCCSIGICSSALFTLYHLSSLGDQAENITASQKIDAMEPLSTHMAILSKDQFGNANTVELETLSPLATYCLYQSAVVQLQLWQRTGDEIYKERVESLKQVLAIFNRRWRVAGMYLKALETERPGLMVPSAGFCLSG